MRRREFIMGLGGAAAWPASLALGQQAPRTARIGYLSPASEPDPNIDSFRQGMRALDYVQDRNFTLEVRYAHRDYSRLPSLVRELLAAKVELIVTGGAASRGAAFAAQSVPVVFGFSGDPVDAGIVASFARPGGNATGVSFLALDLAAKRAELLKEAAPAIKRIAVLSNPEHPGEVSELRVTREAVRKLGIDIQYFPADSDATMPGALEAIAASQCDALLTFPDALTVFHRQRITALAMSRGLPSVFGWKVYTEAGGLVSYGPILRLSHARLAYFVDRILKGAKPADLPVEQPTTLELVVNLKTARALGLAVPTTLISRADAVIE
jgi:putative tryptophan/tyrosine transport system substrate-binding protein